MVPQTGSTGDITVDATASCDNIAALNVVRIQQLKTILLFLAEQQLSIDASGAAAVTYGANNNSESS